MFGLFLLTKAVCEVMKKQNYGRIVHLSPISGKRGGGVFGGAHYSASKAAVLGFSKNLAREVSRYGITTNCVCPGLINTDIWKSMSPEQAKPVIDAIPMGRPGEPEELPPPLRSWLPRRPAISLAKRSTSTAAPTWTNLQLQHK